MTTTQRFYAGLGVILVSSLIYAMHDRGGNETNLFDLLWHAGPMLIALALLIPGDKYRATLDFLGTVLRPRGKDGDS